MQKTIKATQDFSMDVYMSSILDFASCLTSEFMSSILTPEF